VLAGVLLVLGAGASVARGELTSSGNLFVTFQGGIQPTALPRHERAPITVWMDGRVRILSGESPPSLKSITLSLNRNGHLETRGLPICRFGELTAKTSEEAMEACKDALVGSGVYKARLDYVEQEPTPSHGKILAFNATSGGHPAILAQVHTSSPAPATSLIVFHIRHTSGRYGTVLTGAVPGSLSRWGYLKHIALRLHRNYTFRGRRHSYLSAPCPAPPGLSKGSFAFLFASLSFDDGRVLSANLTRTCRAKG
jgi:hypothetical protein